MEHCSTWRVISEGLPSERVVVSMHDGGNIIPERSLSAYRVGDVWNILDPLEGKIVLRDIRVTDLWCDLPLPYGTPPGGWDHPMYDETPEREPGEIFVGPRVDSGTAELISARLKAGRSVFIQPPMSLECTVPKDSEGEKNKAS